MNTPKKLYGAQPSTILATLYTVPAATTEIIKEIVLTNTTATDATITLYLVDSGGTAGATNMLLNAYPVKAKDTVFISMSEVLATGGTIQGLQGTSGAVTVRISGVEVS
ncbi:MAG: hypothetical protein JWM44_2494 [Bacilli bacterium]|nr:hypothetical protein [Bacilli bacterium]